MTIDMVFDRLWKEYAALNPSTGKIIALFKNQCEEVLNDHVAFRTFNLPGIDIEAIARIFLSMGYVQHGAYYFPDKKLNARHYEMPSNASAPRVFISELIIEEFSNSLQNVAKNCLKQIPAENLKDNQMIFSGNQWGPPEFKIYNQLREESEYAAWLYVFGFRANHFTLSVNSLKNFTHISQVNSFLKQNDFVLNAVGGEIKGSSAELLEQSSTLADIVPVSFKEGIFNVPACYYEFAQRYPDSTGKLFSGFIEKSADKIFQSTDYYKK